MKISFPRFLILCLTVTGLLVTPCCNLFEKNQTSNFMLRLLSLTGLPPGEDTTNISEIGTAIIYSDVIHWLDDGTKDGANYFSTDYAIAEVEMGFLNPDITDDYGSVYTDLTIYRVDVEFSRPDGRNLPGETIPRPFSLSVNARLTPDLVLYMPFPVIRVLEKQSRPLSDLYYSGEIQLNCTCTFYARDSGERDAKPETGTITIMCSNYMDLDDTDGGE